MERNFYKNLKNKAKYLGIDIFVLQYFLVACWKIYLNILWLIKDNKKIELKTVNNVGKHLMLLSHNTTKIYGNLVIIEVFLKNEMQTKENLQNEINGLRQRIDMLQYYLVIGKKKLYNFSKLIKNKNITEGQWEEVAKYLLASRRTTNEIYGNLEIIERFLKNKFESAKEKNLVSNTNAKNKKSKKSSKIPKNNLIRNLQNEIKYLKKIFLSFKIDWVWD